jgi:hypothetical protein
MNSSKLYFESVYGNRRGDLVHSEIYVVLAQQTTRAISYTTNSALF